MDVRRIGAIKSAKAVAGDKEPVVIGSETRVKVVKNKVAPPFRQAEFQLLYGEGVSRAGEVLDLAVAAKIISKAGAWYSYREERLGQGRENTVAWLREHPALFADIEAQVRTHYLSGQAELPPVSKRPSEDVAALTDDALTDDSVGHNQ